MPERWESVFRTLLAISLPRLTEAGYNWAMFGSVALRLHGVHVMPRDIDVASDSYDALRVLEDALRPYITKPLAVGCHTAYWGEASLNGTNVDLMVMGNPNPAELCEFRGDKVWQHIRFVDYGGFSVPVFPLEVSLPNQVSMAIQQPPEKPWSRVEAIVATLLQNGYEEELFEEALRWRSLPADVESKLRAMMETRA